MNNDILNQILGLTGLILGIFSIMYAIYQTRVFSKGVKITSLLHIRSLINRMEEEKKEHDKSSLQWRAMHHTQQELETLFQGLQRTFQISDKDAPR